MVYFLAGKTREEPQSCLWSCLLPLPSLHGLGLTVTSRLARNSLSAGCSHAGVPWQTLQFMGDEGKTQGLVICGSEHTLLP